ncbi:MAG TPA: aminotransferase class V-fold PLP-dependent enzyme [Longimicrobiaceae bacterium]|nr:aminotransferase class V-fold PLP-dependent enzyme [Longimicrobiaceae bacterium]
MIHRRNFLTRTAGALGALAVAPAPLLADRLARMSTLLDTLDADLLALGAAADPARLAEDEPFWARVREAFALDPAVVNLDHGWTNPAPREAMADLVRLAREVQSLPAHWLARLWPEVTDTTVRAALAEAMGAPGKQIALVRNATEALDTVLLGVPLRAGDEVVCSAHDYYAMLDALEQRRARDGVVLRMLRPPVPAPSLERLAEMYEAAIGPRTKLVLLTHPSNLTGQLLPVRRIAAAAHAVGAEVVVDGAQSLGLLEEPVAALDCDYYGASAHKWLGVPVGTGVLWMRPEHAAKVWPLIPSPPETAGMSRFEWIGTSPEYVAPAALPALAIHRTLGAARKAERLRYLTSYWRTRAAATLPEARFYTTDGAAMGLGLCTVELPGVESKALEARLLERHGILVQAMSGNARTPEIRGIRVSPNVYTSPAELDRLVRALVAVAAAR